MTFTTLNMHIGKFSYRLAVQKWGKVPFWKISLFHTLYVTNYMERAHTEGGGGVGRKWAKSWSFMYSGKIMTLYNNNPASRIIYWGEKMKGATLPNLPAKFCNISLQRNRGYRWALF